MREPVSIDDSSRAPSAVLVPIFEKDGEYHILFILRSHRVSSHKGQMAFPGGSYQIEDGDLLTTALRESKEEIDLEPADVEILGRLDAQIAMTSNYVMTPFVGFIPYPYNFKVDRRETDSVLHCPVSILIKEGGVHKEIKITGTEFRTSNYYTCGDRIVWGATARILAQFLEIYSRAMTVNT